MSNIQWVVNWLMCLVLVGVVLMVTHNPDGGSNSVQQADVMKMCTDSDSKITLTAYKGSWNSYVTMTCSGYLRDVTNTGLELEETY